MSGGPWGPAPLLSHAKPTCHSHSENHAPHLCLLNSHIHSAAHTLGHAPSTTCPVPQLHQSPHMPCPSSMSCHLTTPILLPDKPLNHALPTLYSPVHSTPHTPVTVIPLPTPPSHTIPCLFAMTLLQITALHSIPNGVSPAVPCIALLVSFRDRDLVTQCLQVLRPLGPPGSLHRGSPLKAGVQSLDAVWTLELPSSKCWCSQQPAGRLTRKLWVGVGRSPPQTYLPSHRTAPPSPSRPSALQPPVCTHTRGAHCGRCTSLWTSCSTACRESQRGPRFPVPGTAVWV